MKHCFIVASVTGREHLLNDFIESVKTSKYRNDDFYLYFQEIPGEKSSGDFDKSFFKDIHISHTRDGACLPRMYWLHNLEEYDFYIIVDDDMEFLGKEDYDTAMAFANETDDCGLCCTNCYRTMRYYESAVPEKIFKKDNVQWIAGGVVIKKSIRNLLVKEIDLKPYSYDGFCIVTYIHGYTNYNYMGSVVLHKAGRKNGFEYVRKNSGEFVSMFEKYIADPFKDKGKLTLPFFESGLTAEARLLHEKNKR